jgi:hypothetical protein
MDPFEGCSIGGMRGVTQKVLSDREVAVFSWCRMRSIPIAFVLAGGYLGPEGSAGLVASLRVASSKNVRALEWTYCFSASLIIPAMWRQSAFMRIHAIKGGM